MLTYIILFLINSIVSCFVRIDLPRDGGAVEVSSISRVASQKLLSIKDRKDLPYSYLKLEYLPRLVGIVARSA